MVLICGFSYPNLLIPVELKTQFQLKQYICDLYFVCKEVEARFSVKLTTN